VDDSSSVWAQSNGSSVQGRRETSQGGIADGRGERISRDENKGEIGDMVNKQEKRKETRMLWIFHHFHIP
jgi:hypothetical protein